MADLASCALLLLAAGSSSRMGKPKQLLSVGGRSLIRGAVDAAIDSGIGTVIVVLGANADKIQPALAGLPVHTVVNDDWKEGMGSSVRSGMAKLDALLNQPQGVIIALADQPGFSAGHVIRLLETHRGTGKSIVASRYAERLSPPVFFTPGYFAALRTLQGDSGARALLQAHSPEVGFVEAGDLGDLDTPDDYTDYLKRQP
jgi:molybdenum cofactor cytidylyltransferase